MQFTSSPRRALGLLAAGTIGLSTALLGVSGVGNAAPAEEVQAPVEGAAETTPWAPYLNYVDGDDRSLTANFTAPEDNGVAVTGYEMTTDGGTTWVTPVVAAEGGRFNATVSGLVNGTTYSVGVRATSAGGPSYQSAYQDGTPIKRVAAPTGITATAAPAALTVSWAAATAGDNPADIYKVEIVEVQEGGMANVTPLCEVPAATLTCSGPAEPGRAHEVVVYAVDTAGDMGVMSARVASGVVPFLATPPAKNGDLVLPAGASSTVAPGTTMTVSGTGYAPFSRVTVLIYSEPQVLKVVIADVNGAFTVEVTVPAGLAVGQHTLVASGLDANGVLRYVSLPVTVSVDSTGATTAKLAATGADVALPLAGGLAALALGGGLIVASRRRSAA